MKKNYSLILRKIIFAFNSISVIGIAIFILYTTRKICDAYVASDFLEKVNAIPANPSALVGEILVLVAIMGISLGKYRSILFDFTYRFLCKFFYCL